MDLETQNHSNKNSVERDRETHFGIYDVAWKIRYSKIELKHLTSRVPDHLSPLLIITLMSDSVCVFECVSAAPKIPRFRYIGKPFKLTSNNNNRREICYKFAEEQRNAKIRDGAQ